MTIPEFPHKSYVLYIRVQFHAVPGLLSHGQRYGQQKSQAQKPETFHKSVALTVPLVLPSAG